MHTRSAVPTLQRKNAHSFSRRSLRPSLPSFPKIRALRRLTVRRNCRLIGLNSGRASGTVTFCGTARVPILQCSERLADRSSYRPGGVLRICPGSGAQVRPWGPLSLRFQVCRAKATSMRQLAVAPQIAFVLIPAAGTRRFGAACPTYVCSKDPVLHRLI